VFASLIPHTYLDRGTPARADVMVGSLPGRWELWICNSIAIQLVRNRRASNFRANLWGRIRDPLFRLLDGAFLFTRVCSVGFLCQDLVGNPPLFPIQLS